MSSQLTINGVSAELERRLVDEATRVGTSVNAVALGILEAAVGTEGRRRRLERYMTWSRLDRTYFESALRAQRTVALPRRYDDSL